ncbi:restriction endonuclease subunit S [Coprothermobacter proteolyticus]|uniref:restriction endonuclease subunit S n=1 Tax=Coprothermobacter proteolyticus TaxID=35786 RepID=UPI000D322C0E|nr:restriction endonuclease subunit S [Coprothermobacter proteolyticus]
MERRVTFYEETNFKTTEIGEIPEDWEVVKLGEVLDEVKTKNKEGKVLKVYSVSNIHGFIESEEFFSKKVYSDDLKPYKVVSKDCFAYNPYRVNVGSIGLFLEEQPCLVSPAYVVFKIKNKEILLPEFLYLNLKSSKYVSEISRMAMSRGSVRQSLSFKDLGLMFLPLPPVEEQKAIAYVLSAVQEAREKTEKVTEATKELKKSLMKHLFTYGPVSLEEASRISLKETEIGEIPADWEVVKLGEVALRMKAGGTPHTAVKEFWNGDIPFVLIEDMTGQGVFLSKTKRMITQEGLRNSSAWLVPANSLLVSMYATIGETAINLIPVATNQAIIAIVPRENFDVLYGAYFIKYDSRRLQMQNIQSTQKNVNRAIVENFSIPLPPLSVQKRIAEILQTVDEKIQAEEKKKQALGNLFNSMLHMLMSGKLRVKFQTSEEGASN